MNLQELLKERERIDNELEKYDAEMQALKELYTWQDIIRKSAYLPGNDFCGININIPPYIEELFLNALQAEIDKIEKE